MAKTNDIDPELTWHGYAIKFVQNITIDPKMHRVLTGTSIVLRPPSTAETVLVQVPRNQLKAIQVAFPDVKVVEPVGVKPEPTMIMIPVGNPTPVKTRPGIEGFDDLTANQIKIEPFDSVTAVIGGGGKKGGGFEGI
jgi:hypothetical protein